MTVRRHYQYPGIFTMLRIVTLASESSVKRASFDRSPTTAIQGYIVLSRSTYCCPDILFAPIFGHLKLELLTQFPMTKKLFSENKWVVNNVSIIEINLSHANSLFLFFVIWCWNCSRNLELQMTKNNSIFYEIDISRI